jgi:RNA polymerase sigma factor (sigma-70 family)
VQVIYTKLLKKLSWIPATLAAKYKPFENYRDIMQTGYLTLFRAILNFDYTKSSNIVGYIYPWVKVEIAKEAWRQKEYLQKYQLVGDSKLLDSTLVGSPEEAFLANEELRLFKNILKKLDTDSNRIITKTFDLDGMGRRSLRQLSDEMGVSHETIRKMRIKAVKKLVTLQSHAEKAVV